VEDPLDSDLAGLAVEVSELEAELK